ncbi:MAG TPA: hypothetical protein VM580_31095 [Labilithrix sp.]|nr:hypothetical protein [Labilithrix sp.]
MPFLALPGAELVGGSTSEGTPLLQLTPIHNFWSYLASAWMNMPALLCDQSSRIALTFTTAGVRIGARDASAVYNSVATAAATGSWNLAIGRWSGMAFELSVNGGAWQTMTHSLSLDPVSNNVLRMGTNYNATKTLEGKVLVGLTGNYRITDASASKLLNWARSRYQLPLN